MDMSQYPSFTTDSVSSVKHDRYAGTTPTGIVDMIRDPHRPSEYDSYALNRVDSFDRLSNMRHQRDPYDAPVPRSYSEPFHLSQDHFTSANTSFPYQREPPTRYESHSFGMTQSFNERRRPEWSYGQQEEPRHRDGYPFERYPERYHDTGQREEENSPSRWEMKQLEDQLSRRQLHPLQQRDLEREFAHRTALFAARIALRGASAYDGHHSLDWRQDNSSSRIATPATTLYPRAFGGFNPQQTSTMSRPLPSIPQVIPTTIGQPFRDDFMLKPSSVRLPPPPPSYRHEPMQSFAPSIRREEVEEQPSPPPPWTTTSNRLHLSSCHVSSPIPSIIKQEPPPSSPSTTQSSHTSQTLVHPTTTTTSSSSTTLPSKRRRCGRKSMNFSSEEKRERNRAAVKKCRQRQALKYNFLQKKARTLRSENRLLSTMVSNHTPLTQEKYISLTHGIQMDIVLKIKEVFIQSLPRDFVVDADSIWDVNAILAVSMPSRCYYGIEHIKEFWKTSLRMRNKGKIRSFWAWFFRLPPNDRFATFDIQSFTSNSNLYLIHWSTKSIPSFTGSILLLFGQGHRVTLQIEIFGWLIWKYLLANQPFPESSNVE